MCKADSTPEPLPLTCRSACQPGWMSLISLLLLLILILDLLLGMQRRQGPFLNSQPTPLFQPNLDPVRTHRVVPTTTYTCFPHRNQGPTAPFAPRADAPCSPGTTAPVVLDPRAAADRVPPRSLGPFTPDALDLRAAANQIDLDGATTPTVTIPPSSPNSATPKQTTNPTI